MSTNALAEKPRKNIIASNIEGTCVYIPCHGHDATTGTAVASIAGVTKGNPTLITLQADTGDWLVGSYVYITNSDTGMTELTTGAYKVTKTDSTTKIYIDVDSTNFTDFAGGNLTVKSYYFVDHFNNLAPQAITGTTTTVFSTSDGITADTVGTGSASAVITTGIEAFDLTGFRGRLFVGSSVGYTAAGGLDGIISTGKQAATGVDSAEGCVNLKFATNQMTFTYRAGAAADGGESNQSAYTGAIGTAKEYHAFILDFSNFPTGVEIYAVNDGVLVNQESYTPTAGATEGGGSSVAIGALLASLSTLQNIAGTGSAGFQFGDIVWWKTTKSVADCIKVANDMANNFELSPRMAV